jgi:hypothetical protein
MPARQAPLCAQSREKDERQIGRKRQQPGPAEKGKGITAADSRNKPNLTNGPL